MNKLNFLKIAEFSFYLFAASFLLSITLSEGAVFLMTICAAVFLTDREKREIVINSLRQSKLFVPFSVFLIFYIFSSVFGLNFIHSISYLDSEIIKILAAFALLSIIFFVDKEKGEIAYAIGLAAASLLGIWQFVIQNWVIASPALYRAHGKMHAVSYSETIAIGFILSLIKYANSAKHKKFWGFVSLVSFTSFVLSFSRGPTLGLLFAMLLLWILHIPSRKYISIFLGILCIVFLSLGTVSKEFRQKIISIPMGLYYVVQPPAKKSIPEENKPSRLDRTSAGRLDMWKTGIKIIKDYPIAGTGPYNVSQIFHFYHPMPVDGRYDWSDVHNLYIQKTVEYGVPGGLAFLYFLWALLRLTIKNYVKRKSDLTLWGLLSVCGFYIMMLTDSSFHLPRVAFNIYFVLAMSHYSAREFEQ